MFYGASISQQFSVDVGINHVHFNIFQLSRTPSVQYQTSLFVWLRNRGVCYFKSCPNTFGAMCLSEILQCTCVKLCLFLHCNSIS